MASRRRMRAASAPERVAWKVDWVDEPVAPASDPAHSKYPRELTDHYDISYTIGDGGFAKVKLAKHKLTGTKVAVKMISKSTLAKKNELYRAANEIASLQLLKHQNIIGLYQVLESRSRVFLVMEYAKGGELFDYICAAGRIQDENKARGFFRQMVRGLAYMHREGFAHRDLKPENMLFDETRTLKLIDLGLVSMPGEDMTKTSCGSANYAAPEVIQGERYYAPTGDMWSLGICLYAMLCGFLPFDDSDLKRLGAKIRRGVFKEPEHLSSDALDILRGLINTDAEKRLTMAQVLRHPWTLGPNPASDRLAIDSTLSKQLDRQIVQVLAKYYAQPEDVVEAQILVDAYDHVTGDYHLMVIAKERFQKLTLVPGGGTWKPRHVAPAEDEAAAAAPTPATVPNSSADAVSAEGAPQVIVDSDEEDVCSLQSSTTSSATPSVSRLTASPKTSRKTRRRGQTTSSPADAAAAMAASSSGPSLSGFFRRLSTRNSREIPTIASSHPVSYQSKASYETLRDLLAEVITQDTTVTRLKESKYTLQVSCNGPATTFQDLKFTVEFVMVGTSAELGLRFKRVKGDSACYSRYIDTLLTKLALLDSHAIKES
eukprot:m.121038 g.121038  ORF g.121038 m.121038 type:complete len:601 (-) comp15626_c0_seq3:152-1954(-)